MIDNLEDLRRRDPGLTGLAVLLDDQQRAVWLAEHGGPDAPSVIKVDYLRYKPGTSLTVGLRTTLGPAFGVAVSVDSRPKLDKLLDKAPPSSVLAVDRVAGLVIALPNADRDLPALADARLSGGRTLSYKPQRRWVGCPAHGQTVWRSYRPTDLPAITDRWPATTTIRVPAVVDHDRRRGLLITERLPGRPLDRISDPIRRQQGLQQAGRALARWHRDAPGSRVPVERSDPSAVADQLVRLLPDQAGRVRRLAAELRNRPDRSRDIGWCHGDFSTDQLLVDGCEVSLLDWDRSGYGPQAVDLASADAAGFSRTGRPGLADHERTALYDGYRTVRDLPDDLDHWRAMLRFVRAAEPFRQARADWPAAIRDNLDRVETLLR